jgi:putative membrane protein
MWKRTVWSAGIAILALVWAAGSHAQQPGVVVIVTDPDQQFIIQAAQGGTAEVAMGQLAATRAVNDAVRRFGQRMILDHGAMNGELQALAAQQRVPIVTEMGPQHRATYDRLASLTGLDFDRTYVAEMVIDHDKDVSEFERVSQTARDPDVRAWASSKLPVLREHQSLARQLHGILAQAPISTPAALPAAVVVVPAAPAPPWCGGSWRPDGGSNFSGCSR